MPRNKLLAPTRRSNARALTDAGGSGLRMWPLRSCPCSSRGHYINEHNNVLVTLSGIDERERKREGERETETER